MPFERRRRGRVGFDALAPMLGPRTCHALLLLLVEVSLPLWRKHDFTAAAALGRLGHNADAIVAAWRRGGLYSRLLSPKERFDYGHHRSVRARAACRRCRHGRCELGLLRPAPNRGRVLHRRHALLPACPRAPRDAVGNDVGLAPEAKTDESSSSHSVADFKAVLTAASGRSLPLSVVRLPCGQLEVRAVAFCAEPHTLHVSYNGVAIRRSPRPLTVCPGPLDLRHVTSVVDAGEAGRVAITAIARDVFGNEVGANLLGAAILPYGATAIPKTTDTGLGDRFEVPRPAHYETADTRMSPSAPRCTFASARTEAPRGVAAGSVSSHEGAAMPAGATLSSKGEPWISTGAASPRVTWSRYRPERCVV